MNPEIRRLLADGDGVLARGEALTRVPAHVLEHATRAGHVRRLHPRVYVDPARCDEHRLRWRAAQAYAGPESALCGLTALTVWELRRRGTPYGEVACR